MQPTPKHPPASASAGDPIGIVIIATEGSRWELWETEHRYRRSPLTETSRGNPAWGGPEAGPLQDHVWHEFSDWHVAAYPFGTQLVIVLPDGSRIRGPHPNRAVGTQHVCARCTREPASDDPLIVLLDQCGDAMGDDL